MLRRIANSALLVFACVLAYANSFRVPAVFDDIAGIAENKSIEHLSTAFAPPESSSLSGRPFANLTLALNYALSGRNLWSYHLANLALHVVSVLTLASLIRRTLELRDAKHAGSIAALASLLWALHPLQTASVTYLMQRTELLVSACYLLTLCCFLRGAHPMPEGGARRPRRASSANLWLSASVVFCALGMASKEIMVTAPVVVLLYDRCFLAGTFRAALRARGFYYLSLFATWGVLLALVLGTENRGASAGFAAGISSFAYLQTQVWALVHYLRLALWPSPLVFDYGVMLVTDRAALLLGAVVVLALLALTAWLLRRRPAPGFCGAWFFLLLAPTSSVVPIATQTVAEHRVYLALAAPVLLVVILAHRWLGRGAWLVGAPVALALGCATLARNQVYASAVTLWRDTVAKQPANGRAHYNLGLNLLTARELPEAEKELRAALALEPENARARHQFGVVLLQTSRAAEALPLLQAAAQQRPSDAATQYDLGNALVALGRAPEALPPLSAAARLDPALAAAHYNLGHVLAQLGRYPEALAEFEIATRLDPNDAAAKNNAARLRAYLQK